MPALGEGSHDIRRGVRRGARANRCRLPLDGRRDPVAWVGGVLRTDQEDSVNPIQRSAAIALASGVAVASLAAPSAANARPSTTTAAASTNPAAAAAGWLSRGLQGAHHDHFVDSYVYQGTTYSSPDDGETADAVLSMDAAGVGQRAARRATTWLESDAKNYLTGSGYTKAYYPGQAGKLLLVAVAQHVSPTSFGGVNLVRTIVKSEGAGKGTHRGQYQNPDDTAYGSSITLQSLALLGLSAARPSHGPDHAAKAFLTKQACPNGGFQNGIRTAKCGTEDVDATGFAIQALIATNAKKSVIARAVHWLIKHENSDGGWAETPGTKSDANSTAIATEALIAAQHKVAKAERWLRHQQVGCGGPAANRGAVRFQGAKFNATTDVRATSQAGVALAKGTLNSVTKHGATAGSPVMSCSRKH